MNKIAFVIGGSSGIGLATIRKLLDNNYIVYNGSRRVCPDQRVKSFEVDVANYDTIKYAIDCIYEKHSAVDLLIYSAGFSMASPVENVNEEDYRYLFDVNFFGAIEAIKFVIPIMKRQGGGKIIIVSSVGGVIPIAYDSFYSSSKAAVNMLCSSLRLELEKYNIYTTSVMPGGTKNNFTFKRKVYNQDEIDGYEDFSKAVLTLAEIEQTGESNVEVANTIYKVASSKNPPVLVTSGLINKASYFLSKFIPLKILLFVTKKKFKTK